MGIPGKNRSGRRKTGFPVPGTVGMYGCIWEWATDRGVDDAALGVSGTRHGAMAALSRTLVKAEGPASGHVVSVALVDGRSGFGYLRLNPALTANYENHVIRWHKTAEAVK